VICSASSASAFVSPCTYDASHYIYMGKDAEGLPTGVKMQIVWPVAIVQINSLELNRSGPFTDADLKGLSKSSDRVVSYKAKNAQRRYW